MNESGAAIGIYLLVEAATGAVERLSAALAGGPVQSVLVTPVGAAGRSRARADVDLVRRLAGLAQSADAAGLVADDVELAEAVGADGVHLSWSADLERAFDAARRTVGRQRIVGVSVGASRHDAMVLAEAGADYIGFTGDAGGIDDQVDMVAWWAEIFETPCVAFDVNSPEAARRLISAGADFLATRLPGGQTPADAAGRVAMLATAIAAHRCGGRQ